MYKRSTAHVDWTGTLADGEGLITTESGALDHAQASWRARTGTQLFRRPGVRAPTNPEELLAAAHATCFAMALAHRLEQAGHTPRALHVAANCFLERQDLGGIAIREMSLQVTGDVPDIAESEFVRIAEKAEERCPITLALTGNVGIHLTARLSKREPVPTQ